MKNSKELLKSLSLFEKKTGYFFSDKSKLINSLTHSSYANERKNECLKYNERLEFLGDSILSFTISEKLFNVSPEIDEGIMTKVRASIVCEASLMKCAQSIGIGSFILLGRGEELTGGRTRVSILSDAVEALIGAIYNDGGISPAKAFILIHFEEIISISIRGINFTDYKTQLQEIIQKNGEKSIIYEIVEEKGPDHSKIFVSQITIEDKVMGMGEGKSKKEAEQNAARTAFCNLGR